MQYRVGIDVGGTFTDLALLSSEGHLYVFKVPTRRLDNAEGCIGGLKAMLEEAKVSARDVVYWSHGSTVATNAIVERKGARTALLVTEGFRDILEIRRQIKPDRYDLHRLKPEPLVSRDRRLEVRERILWDGSVYVSLSETDLRATLDQLEKLEIEAVAICFLHSYANPAHEQSMQEAVRHRFPSVYISSSHEVLPEFREYPRCATTVANAYVGPVMARYLERFDRGGRDLGIQPPLTIFQSNGGIVSASGAARQPVRVLYSGPAAGVRGAVHVAHETGATDVITFDMGGTSCDVCLIRAGAPLLTGERELIGFPVRTPMIDVHSIGAGGGSIARVDKGGLLQVGPESAGSDPGPACYGRGGISPTVTDANVVLGRLNPRGLLGGRLEIHESHAREAIAQLADRLLLPIEQIALSILDVVNSNMMGAIRVVTVERGYDYREFALLAFGGAGPLHAADVARQMNIRTVLIPRNPGILCAMGLLVADYRSDFTRTHILPAKSEMWEKIHNVFHALEEQAQNWAAAHEIPSTRAELGRFVTMRYVGQSYQLSVTAHPIHRPLDVEELVKAFHNAHRTAYGYAQTHASVEAVDFHVTLVVSVPRPKIVGTCETEKGVTLREARIGKRSVWFKSRTAPLATTVYRRDRLAPESTIRGPAIIEQLDSTIMVPPDTEAIVERGSGNIRLALS